ncbi:cytochrome p450 [Holotrichia oblita]|uniref:Cytochrome p450 n=1 Tax=Holotrichia oblita TaxID=644536 RepID=A0ACB9TFI5_HOLOL|nr:cytochrome p450 [Holotrichia oblita]
MVITLTLGIICLLLYILYFILNGIHSRYWKVRGVPCVKQPFLGNAYNTFILKQSIGSILRKHYFQFDEPFFGFMTFGTPHLIIKCPDLIKNILVRDFNHFQDRHVTFEEEMDDFSSNMIFFMKHPKWKMFRSKTTSVFSSKNLKSMYPQMQVVTKNLIDFMNSKSKASTNIVNLFAKYTTQTGLMVAFGVDSNSFQDNDTPFVSAGKDSFNVSFATIIAVLCHRWKFRLGYIFKPQIVTSSLMTFLKKAFIHILEERKSLNNYRGDFVDFLIKFKNESNVGSDLNKICIQVICDSEIVALATQFLLAGYESANITISLAVYELALNKSIQTKLREEILSNLDPEGDISYDAVNTMQYLDKIVYEMVITLTLGIICLLLYILYFILNGIHSRYWKVRGVPCVKQPFLGNAYNTFILKQSIGSILRKHYFQFDEPFFGFMTFGTPHLIIKCPDLIKNILVRDFNHFQDRHVTFEEEMDDFSSNMIFFMKHPKWKMFRSKTTSVFSSKNLKSMYPQMQVVTKNLIDFMNSKSKASTNIVNLFAKYTTQTGLMVAFGVDSNSFQDNDTPFVSAGKDSFNVSFATIIAVLCHRWKFRLGYIFKPQIVTSSLMTFLKKAFIHILEERKSLNNYRGDFVDFLIKFKNESNVGSDLNKICIQVI